MRKKLKGSALLWAICSLMVVAFVLTGLLAVNKSYAEEEINNVASRRAEYLARSGVELTIGLIKENKLEKISSMKNFGKNTRYTEAVVTYSMDEEVTVTVTKIGDNLMRLDSSVSAGNMSRTVSAVLKYKSGSTGWELDGYVTK
ncbi:MAG: hypothetical protein PUE12_07555 [Oscillospiraceae bacterium]|nr:hypothetical protein [Oscillospiraceae bacterium]